MKPLLTHKGIEVFQDPNNRVHYIADMDVDCDGSKHSYRFDNSFHKGALDDIHASAGWPDEEWWNVLVRDPNDHNKPYVDEDGFCISMTSYRREGFGLLDRRRFLDAATIPYVVMPGKVRQACRGILCGSRARVTDVVTDIFIDGVIGDFSGGNIGEAGLATAKFFDESLSPSNGDDRTRYLYEAWPGTVPEFNDPVTGEPFKLQPFGG